MLEDAPASLSGDEKHRKKTVDIKLAISAYISDDYIMKIELDLNFRRLSKLVIFKVYKIEEEMEDRFGKPDIYTNSLSN